MKFKRVFVLVMDSVGIGYEPDADRFFNAGHNDVGSNTWVHTASACKGLNIPTLNALGLHDLAAVEGTEAVSHPHSYIQAMRETSNGKDTLTGHWEMMGIETKAPLITFTDHGFPKELIEDLEQQAHVSFLGNYASSGTVILDELGERSIQEKKMILYTSADSVLQIAASLEVFTLEELYRVCELARAITMKPEWKVGRVIARPFLGTKKGHFVRTSDRRDYSLAPEGKTAMLDLMENGYQVIAVGKIHDIFAGTGMNESFHIESNHDGMEKTIFIAKEKPFTGMCFVNLADFDVLFGHRRDPLGYGKSLEEFDTDLQKLIDVLQPEDLLMITADHGNDPTWYGTDHTREKVPLISYSKSYHHGRLLPEVSSFGSIGKTVLLNFEIVPSANEIGEVIQQLVIEE